MILTVRCGILSKVVWGEIYGNDIVTEQHHYNTRILDVFRVRRRAHHREINNRLLQVEGFSLAAVEHGDVVRRVGTWGDSNILLAPWPLSYLSWLIPAPQYSLHILGNENKQRCQNLSLLTRHTTVEYEDRISFSRQPHHLRNEIAGLGRGCVLVELMWFKRFDRFLFDSCRIKVPDS